MVLDGAAHRRVEGADRRPGGDGAGLTGVATDADEDHGHREQERRCIEEDTPVAGEGVRDLLNDGLGDRLPHSSGCSHTRCCRDSCPTVPDAAPVLPLAPYM